MNAVAPADLGKASGTFTTMRQLGGVFGLAIVVAVFTGAGRYASPASFGTASRRAIAVSAAFSLAAALVGLALPARPRRVRAADDGDGARGGAGSLTREIRCASRRFDAPA